MDAESLIPPVREPPPPPALAAVRALAAQSGGLVTLAVDLLADAEADRAREAVPHVDL